MPLTVAVPAFRDNYIWVHCASPSAAADPASSESCSVPTGARCIIVDPGDAEPVLRFLRRHQLDPAAVFITHHHGDHIGGLDALREHYPMPVYGPRGGHIPAIDHRVVDGTRIDLGPDLGTWQVLAIPGHTLDHLGYYDGNRLFCGDTVFGAGCGRLFEGTPEQMHASLNKLAALPTTTWLYCAHEYTQANLAFARAVEPENNAIQQRSREVAALRARGAATVPSRLDSELATNPFLRCAQPAVRAAAERHAARPLDTPAAVFAVLRAWKDEF